MKDDDRVKDNSYNTNPKRPASLGSHPTAPALCMQASAAVQIQAHSDMSMLMLQAYTETSSAIPFHTPSRKAMVRSHASQHLPCQLKCRCEELRVRASPKEKCAWIIKAQSAGGQQGEGQVT